MRQVHSMPFGAQVVEGGVRFRLWAPTAREVSLVIGDRAPIPLQRDADGWLELTLGEARAGDDYCYLVDGTLRVPDPASRFQPDDAHGPSRIVDPATFAWSDAAWRGRAWEEAVLYELHVGTFTPEGTFQAAAEKLEGLRDLGITAVELLPLADFPGRRGWGYDGVLHYAPDAAYGTPDDLKRLVDRAHSLGLMMFLDVVYNHFGPSGNYLHAYAERFFTSKHETPWGKAINYDDRDARVVRDFFVHNTIYWLEEFRFDGLRFDAVHAIRDDGEEHFLTELATRARAALPGRHIHLVLENDSNEASRLVRKDGRAGLYDAQWNDDIHHIWHRLLTGETDGYYGDYEDRPAERLARALAEGFDYQGEPSPHREGEFRGEASADLPPAAFVAFLQNHDQVGNRAFGDRLTVLADPDRLALATAILLLAPSPPMLFMGEEWGSTTPFLFFCDFSADPALARAVREGRRKEFSKFLRFSQAEEDDIPDPGGETAFLSSKLDWRERDANAALLERTRALLALRRDRVVPLLASGWKHADHHVEDDFVRVDWHFAAGTLRLALNLSDAAREAPLVGEELWSSENAGIVEARATLAPWSACLMLETHP